MSDTIVTALQSFAGRLGKDQVIYVHKGENFESSHPAVKKWPEHFGPVELLHPVQRTEQATAAPGEKRGEKR